MINNKNMYINNTLIRYTKEKLPTTIGDKISFFWCEKVNLISWRVGWKLEKESMVNPIKIIVENKDKFRWVDKNKTYQVTIKRYKKVGWEWKEKVEVFLQVQDQKKIKYYKSLSKEPNKYKNQSDSSLLFFVCYEVFPKNNFKEIKTPQSVINQYLYDKGHIFNCQKCRGKLVIRACGETPLSIYSIDSSELCTC